MSERVRIARKKETANEVPPIVQDVLSSSGQPLNSDTRDFMEPRFGHDFSQVRVHTDERAVESAEAVNALAYTVGRDVVFGEGQYEPETGEGKRLLAHELTHVVQQSRGGHQTPPPISTHPLEQVAQQAASTVASGGTAHVEGASAPGIARHPRSINESLDPTSMSDADLAREIALIRQWLTENPASSAEQNQLMSALSTMETEVAQRNGRQNQASTDQGQQPDSASAGIPPVLAAGMLSPVTPLSPTTPPPGTIPEGAFNNWPRIPGEAPFQAPELAPELAPEALELGAGAEVLAVGAGAEVLAVGAGAGAVETVTFLGLTLTPVGWVILAVGVGIVAGFAIYEGVNYLLKEDGTPARPLTPEENLQAKANEGKSPADFPGQGGQSPAVDPITGEKLYTPANQDQAPWIDPTTGEKLYTPADQSSDEPLQAAGKPMSSPFSKRLTQEVISEMSIRPGGEYAETWEFVDLEGPHALAQEDPLLLNSPHARRYQARFRDFTGKIEEISVNYDPDTDRFGTIKPASGK